MLMFCQCRETDLRKNSSTLMNEFHHKIDVFSGLGVGFYICSRAFALMYQLVNTDLMISIPVISRTWGRMFVIASGRYPWRLFHISRRAIALIVSIWSLKQTFEGVFLSTVVQSQIMSELILNTLNVICT